MLYLIGWVLCYLFAKFYLNFKVIGRKNVPQKGSFIFASNHSSYLDPVLLGVSLFRSLNYMGRDTLFKRRCFGWVLKNIHVFPVKRKVGDLRAIKESLSLLKNGKPLVIFPEGTRTKDGNLKRGKRGIGFLTARSRVPVVPAYIKGSFEALPRGVKTLKRSQVKIYIGKPVHFDNIYQDKIDKELYRKISDDIIERIAVLKHDSEAR